LRTDVVTAVRLADDVEALLRDVPTIDGGEGLAWLALIDAREAAADGERARDALLEAFRRVSARAARIRRPALALSFWAVPEHAELRRRAVLAGLSA
jgi:hypothetical protein